MRVEVLLLRIDVVRELGDEAEDLVVVGLLSAVVEANDRSVVVTFFGGNGGEMSRGPELFDCFGDSCRSVAVFDSFIVRLEPSEFVTFSVDSTLFDVEDGFDVFVGGNDGPCTGCVDFDELVPLFLLLFPFPL